MTDSPIRYPGATLLTDLGLIPEHHCVAVSRESWLLTPIVEPERLVRAHVAYTLRLPLMRSASEAG